MKVLIFYHETGATRLFSSLNLAQEHYGNNVVRRAFFSPKDLIDRYSGGELLYAYESLFLWADSRGSLHYDTENAVYAKTKSGEMSYVLAPHPRDVRRLSDSDLAEKMWEIAWIVGDPVRKPPQHSTRPGFVIDLAKAKTTHDLWSKRQVKMPKQAAMIALRLAEEQYDFYTEDEMVKFMESHKTTMLLNTKQDPWRIFRYYRPKLEELGIVNPQGDA